MLSAKSIAAFAVKFLVVYGLVAASWTLIGGAYGFFFRESGNVLFEALGANRDVRIRAATRPDGINDSALIVRHEAAGGWLTIHLSSWLMGFQPTGILIALVVATPVAVQRRFWALCGGFAIIHAFVLLRLATFVVLSHVTVSKTLLMNAIRWAISDFLHGHALAFILPVLVWLLVTVRWPDASRLFGSTQIPVTA